MVVCPFPHLNLLSHAALRSVAEHPHYVLTRPIFDALRTFARFPAFKRYAIHTIAFFLDPRDLLDQQKAFSALDLDHNGYLDHAELREAINQVEGVEPVGPTELQSIFDSMDDDHSGMIEQSEFIAASMRKRFFTDESSVLPLPPPRITWSRHTHTHGRFRIGRRQHAVIWVPTRGTRTF